MQRLLWVDTETTGLDPKKGALLEVALVVTDENLKGENTLHMPIAHKLQTLTDSFHITDFVMEMHEKSGLFRLCEQHGVPLEDAQKKCVEWIKEVGAEKMVIAGSNPAFDRMWLEVHMPEVAALFHYRSFDMNTLYYFFDIVDEIKDGDKVLRRHRALDDVNLDISVAQQILSMLDARHYVKRGINRVGLGLPWCWSE
jgi:oligoribonuclease